MGQGQRPLAQRPVLLKRSVAFFAWKGKFARLRRRDRSEQSYTERHCRRPGHLLSGPFSIERLTLAKCLPKGSLRPPGKTVTRFFLTLSIPHYNLAISKVDILFFLGPL